MRRSESFEWKLNLELLRTKKGPHTLKVGLGILNIMRVLVLKSCANALLLKQGRMTSLGIVATEFLDQLISRDITNHWYYRLYIRNSFLTYFCVLFLLPHIPHNICSNFPSIMKAVHLNGNHFVSHFHATTPALLATTPSTTLPRTTTITLATILMLR